jgi:hypothetical protein
MIKSILKSALIGGCLLSGLGLGQFVLQTPLLVADAHAASRAAHRHHHRHDTRARRTTRRVVRSTHVYVNRLPAGCTTVVVDGTRLHHCGRTYYRPHGNRFVVVVIE